VKKKTELWHVFRHDVYKYYINNTSKLYIMCNLTPDKQKNYHAMMTTADDINIASATNCSCTIAHKTQHNNNNNNNNIKQKAI